MEASIKQIFTAYKHRHKEIMDVYDSIVETASEIDILLSHVSYKRSITEANMSTIIKSHKLIKELKSKL